MSHLGRTCLIGVLLLPACSRLPVERSDSPLADRQATPASQASNTPLPPELTINKRAGGWSLLLATVRLEGGPEFQCIVDTGSPASLLPKSAEPLLGKRLASGTFPTLDSKKEPTCIYAAPKLYLGDSLLMTDKFIGTWNSSLGVLGMDCLHHYCIQLDFEAGKVRFLDPDQACGNAMGKAYPLIYEHYAFVQHAGLLETNATKSLLDTGCFCDGCVNSRTFQRESKRQNARPVPLLEGGIQKGYAPGFASFSNCIWDGEPYKDLLICKGIDLIGLRFLARHKVTLNFPKGVMYLKRSGVAPTKDSG